MQAINKVLLGQRYLSVLLPEQSIEAYLQLGDSAESDPYETLTPREREVLRQMGEGYTNSPIAERLSISQRTVEFHRYNVMGKLGLSSQSEAVRYVLQRGILPME